jgi:fatty-acyl-CoA synthase
MSLLDAAPWVEGLTLSRTLRATAARVPDSDAIVFPSISLRWTWAEFDRRVDRIAAGLLHHGVLPGEHIGIWSMNSPEWVLLQFAAARAGAVLVNINPAYRLHELEDALRMARVRTLVVGQPFKTSNFVQMAETLVPELASAPAPDAWRSDRLPDLARVIAVADQPHPGWFPWAALDSQASHPDLLAREADTDPRAVFNIQFTSGTTGLPKGAMLTHRNVLMNAYYIGQRLAYTEDDRVCVPVPFYHCFGCVMGTTVCAVYGSALVVPAPSFDPKATLASIAAERCTSIYGVPAMFVSQLEHPDFESFNLKSLRTGIMAGSPCPLPLMERVIQRMGPRQITIAYGLTEASPVITQTSVDDPLEVRTATVGKPLPGIEVRLVHPATRNHVNEGETGELEVRGHNVMAGYFNAPAATAHVITPDGWLGTGDLARRRPDGNYKIVGRSKELIIRGGENIYPPEIEEFLLKHPAISEVAVVGLPDPVYGEVVSAWIVPKPGCSLSPEQLQSFCQGQIAYFKIPRYIEFTTHLPRTVTGKIRKHVLREQGIEKYGLGDAAATPTA